MKLLYLCTFEFQAPANSGSAFWNYKECFSVILLAVADANAMFTMVDIGSEGRNSDAGILVRSEMGQGLESNTLNIPSPTPIEPNGPALPFVLVGDEAFGLSSYMMRPLSCTWINFRKKSVQLQRKSSPTHNRMCFWNTGSTVDALKKKNMCFTSQNY